MLDVAHALLVGLALPVAAHLRRPGDGGRFSNINDVINMTLIVYDVIHISLFMTL